MASLLCGSQSGRTDHVQTVLAGALRTHRLLQASNWPVLGMPEEQRPDSSVGKYTWRSQVGRAPSPGTTPRARDSGTGVLPGRGPGCQAGCGRLEAGCEPALLEGRPHVLLLRLRAAGPLPVWPPPARPDLLPDAEEVRHLRSLLRGRATAGQLPHRRRDGDLQGKWCSDLLPASLLCYTRFGRVGCRPALWQLFGAK